MCCVSESVLLKMINLESAIIQQIRLITLQSTITFYNNWLN